MKFAGPMKAVYLGGKSDGVELTLIAPNLKPKKIREYGCDVNGIFRFTTDSAGMSIRLTLLVEAKVAAEEEKSEADLKFVNEACEAWHKNENDGTKFIGRFCPECGDSRKLVPEAV